MNPDELPNGWDFKPLEEVCDYIQRGKQPEYDDEDGRVNIINQRCIYWDSLHLENTRKLDEDHEDTWQEYRYLQQGDVLLNSTGEGTLGRAQIWNKNTDKEYVVDGHVTILRTSPSVKPYFLFYFLQSPMGQSQIETFTKGATGQTELYKKHITTINIPVPPLEEQERIVREIEERLDTITTLEHSINNIQQLSNEYEVSHLAHLFIGDTSSNEMFLSDETIPEDWGMHKLKDIIQMESGGRPKGSVDSYDSDIPSIGGSEIDSRGNILLDDPSMIPQEYYNSMNTGVIKPKDILLVKDGKNTGDVAIVDESIDEEMAINSHVYILRLNSKIDILYEYLGYYLMSPLAQRHIESQAKGAAQKGINMSFADDLNVPIPPVEQQKEIIDRIKQVDFSRLNSKTLTVNKLIEEYKNSVLSEAFSSNI